MEKKLLGSSKVTSSNQVTLPVLVRTKLNIKSGELVAFYELEDGTIIIQK
ncbi:MAG: AbrB/MazE/SpoVT family DNA-binding domain-containing protein [Candidatus Hodarchaeota archaeon]